MTVNFKKAKADIKKFGKLIRALDREQLANDRQIDKLYFLDKPSAKGDARLKQLNQRNDQITDLIGKIQESVDLL